MPSPAAPETTTNPEALATCASTIVPESFAIELFPNPGGAQRTLGLHLPTAAVVAVAIVDVLGRRVSEEHLEQQAGVCRLSLELGTLPSGTYLLVVTTPAHRRVVPFAVAR